MSREEKYQNEAQREETDRKLFNPSKFADILDENAYASGAKGKSLTSERVKLVGWLRKKGNKSQPCLDLADKLADCRKKHRCKSAACPECAVAGQRLMAGAARRFLKAQASGNTIVCVSVIPADGVVKPGKLSPADQQRAVRRWKEKLGKGGVASFVGATDISFNEHKSGRYKPYWSIHFFGLTVTDDLKLLKRKLRKHFLSTDSIAVPVKVAKWDDDPKALRYILKPNFWRRVGTDNAERHDTTTGGTRTCRATDKQRLPSRRKRELLVYLDHIGMQGRFVMKWCQLLNRKDRGPRIVMRHPK
jgi:hypothetical protein